MKELESMFDIVLLIIMLATGASIGLKAVYKAYREVESYQASRDDKNVQIREYGAAQVEENAGNLSRGELLIMTQIQDRGLSRTYTFETDSSVDGVGAYYEVDFWDPGTAEKMRNTLFPAITESLTGYDNISREYRIFYDCDGANEGSFIIKKISAIP